MTGRSESRSMTESGFGSPPDHTVPRMRSMNDIRLTPHTGGSTLNHRFGDPERIPCVCGRAEYRAVPHRIPEFEGAMMKGMTRTISTSVLVLASLLGSAPAGAEPHAQFSKVEVAFVLDSTGSMTGLIEGAKQKIWAIANSIVALQLAPEGRIGLVSYRDRGDQYVTRRGRDPGEPRSAESPRTHGRNQETGAECPPGSRRNRLRQRTDDPRAVSRDTGNRHRSPH